jgi:hypothetical protein
MCRNSEERKHWRKVITRTVYLIVLAIVSALCVYTEYKHNIVIDMTEVEDALRGLEKEYRERDYADFFSDSGVRGARDEAAGEFRRKRDEAVERIRGRCAGSGSDGGGGGSD